MKMHHSWSDESGINQLSRSYSEHSDSPRRSVSHLHFKYNEQSSSLWCCILEVAAPADFGVSAHGVISPRFKQSVAFLTYFWSRALENHSPPFPMLSEDSLPESYLWASDNLDPYGYSSSSPWAELDNFYIIVLQCFFFLPWLKSAAHSNNFCFIDKSEAHHTVR